MDSEITKLLKMAGKAKTYRFFNLLNALSELFGDSEGMTNDEIREELRAEGFDIDGAEKRLLEFQKKVSAISKMEDKNGM